MSASASAPPGTNPPATGPAAWGKAFASLVPALPKYMAAEGEPAPIAPSCANHEARRIANEKFGEFYLKRVAQFADSVVDRDTYAVYTILGWERVRATLAHELDEGFFLGPVAEASRLAEAPVVDAPCTKVAFKESATGERFRKALAGGGRAGFQCALTHAARVANGESRLEGNGFKAGPVDWVTCDLAGGDSVDRVAIELPRGRPIPIVARKGDALSVKEIEYASDPTDAALRSLLERVADGDQSAIRGATIRVSGVSHVWHFPNAVETAAKIAMLGAPNPVIDSITDGTWIVAFDPPCEAKGLGCQVEDVAEPGAVKFVGYSAVPSAKPTPSIHQPSIHKHQPDRLPTLAVEETRGLWEDAVLAVDPKANEPNSKSPWNAGFYSTNPNSAFSLEDLPATGDEVTKIPVLEGTNTLIDGWRREIKKRGGVGSFRCTVMDLGQRHRDWSAIMRAALKETRTPRVEARDILDIVCQGDADSYVGPIVVSVPTYAAWAVIEASSDPMKGKVRKWNAEHHGWFEPRLREQLVDVAAGTVLEIKAMPRLTRYLSGAFGIESEIPGVVWGVDLREFACPYEGLGCPLFDGVTLPVITAKTLESCPASSYVWPPQLQKPLALDPALAGITAVDPPVPVKVRTRVKDGAEQVYVGAGAFPQGDGSPKQAVRKVFVPGFWIDRIEITAKRYEACEAAGECKWDFTEFLNYNEVHYNVEIVEYIHKIFNILEMCGRDNYDREKDKNGDLVDVPVRCLNRAQAAKYCEWVGSALPTNIEWEKAARGLDARPFPWGWSNPNCGLASLSRGGLQADKGCHHGRVEPVGRASAGASPYGVLDLVGSVAEWVNVSETADKLITHSPPTGGQVAIDTKLVTRGVKASVRNQKRYGALRGGSHLNERGSVQLSATSQEIRPSAHATEVTGFRCVNQE